MDKFAFARINLKNDFGIVGAESIGKEGGNSIFRFVMPCLDYAYAERRRIEHGMISGFAAEENLRARRLCRIYEVPARAAEYSDRAYFPLCEMPCDMAAHALLYKRGKALRRHLAGKLAYPAHLFPCGTERTRIFKSETCGKYIVYAAIERIEGSFYNVMGLPVQKVYTELDKFLNP